MSYKPAAHLAPVTKTQLLIGREETRWRTPGRWLADAARQLTSVRCRPWSCEHLERVTTALLASKVSIISLPTLERLLQAEVVLFYSLIKTVTCKQWGVDQASRGPEKRNWADSAWHARVEVVGDTGWQPSGARLQWQRWVWCHDRGCHPAQQQPGLRHVVHMSVLILMLYPLWRIIARLSLTTILGTTSCKTHWH